MLTRLCVFICSILFISFIPPATPQAGEGIQVVIHNLRNEKGNVLVSLFREGEGFPDDASKAYSKARLTISGKKASAFFTSLPAGKYAIAILHDENADMKMNTNFLGLPREGYGFSNNVMGTFGPPSYSRAAFSHNTGKTTHVTIKTRY